MNENKVGRKFESESLNLEAELMIDEMLLTTQDEITKWTAEEFARRVIESAPRVAVFDCDGTLWSCDSGVTAVVAVGSQEEIAAVVAEVGLELPGVAIAAAFPMRRSLHGGRWAMIVRSAAGTKGTALRWIAEHEGVAMEDTVCVGDWINDVPMFEVAGRSFVMAQAPDEVKARATDRLTVTSVEGGGVAFAVKAAFGIDAG